MFYLTIKRLKIAIWISAPDAIEFNHLFTALNLLKDKSFIIQSIQIISLSFSSDYFLPAFECSLELNFSCNIFLIFFLKFLSSNDISSPLSIFFVSFGIGFEALRRLVLLGFIVFSIRCLEEWLNGKKMLDLRNYFVMELMNQMFS